MTVPISSVPVSTVPKFLSYLTSGLTANLTQVDAQTALGVAYIELAANYDPFDSVVIGDAHTRTAKREQMVGTGGAGWLFESYSVDLQIVSWQGGNNFQPVTDRAWRLLGLVEGFLRSDPSCGGLVIEAYPAASKSSAGYMDNGKGISCVIDLTVDVEARI
jgi:hypothetical protein